MKKVICFGILLIFLANSALAISTTIEESYSKGETVTTGIFGNILEPISASQVEFRRGHVLVPFDYEVRKLGEDYYLWFITPENEINYTLIIKDVTTTVSGQVQKVTYEKNFSVSGNLSSYTLKPGFVYAEEDFEIKVQLNKDYDEQIDLNFIEASEFTLKPGENIIGFSIPELNESSLFNITLGEYLIPAYIKSNKTAGRPPIIDEEKNQTTLNLTNITDLDIEELPEEEKEIINQERAKYHCFEYPGKICAADEVCTGETIVSADGPCCIGLDAACAKEGEGGSLAWVGYLLGAIVVIAGIFFWIRYKKIKAEKNPLEKKVQALERKPI